MIKEMWKDIKGYEGIYQASNLGRIKSLNYNQQKYEKILKPVKQKTGYYLVNLKGNALLLHRVIANTFLENPNNFKTINHKDGNKANNSVDNLEWCSYSDNLKHAYKNKLKIATSNHLKKKIIQYDKNYNFIKIWGCSKDIERELKISHSNISKCCKHILHNNTAGGYKWEYLTDEQISNMRLI